MVLELLMNGTGGDVVDIEAPLLDLSIVEAPFGTTPETPLLAVVVFEFSQAAPLPAVADQTALLEVATSIFTVLDATTVAPVLTVPAAMAAASATIMPTTAASATPTA